MTGIISAEVNSTDFCEKFPMKDWKKNRPEKAQRRILKALAENVSFNDGSHALGYPVSRLDTKVFHDAPFLKDAPLLMAYVANPNHIGCHTVGESEHAFGGTQRIERDVLSIVAETIFKAEENSYDGYIAAGGTEANLQALWIYRNIFLKKQAAKLDEIAIITSEDTHYSIAKGSNLLMVDLIKVPIDFHTRGIDASAYIRLLEQAVRNGKKYFIVVANMGTTMFGSVDNPAIYIDALKQRKLPFFLHIDAAYGGFIYPFLHEESTLNFTNPDISSMTVDAHKMLQAPYGTGIFLCRKGLIENVLTEDASYVEGLDLTLCGSRSGANVIAVWMILKAYGYNGWFEKVKVLQMRTDWLCKQLDDLGIGYFREPFMNIVTLNADFVNPEIAYRFQLVPEKHGGSNRWFKIVVMDHVEVEVLAELLAELTPVAVEK